ncbi:MAG: hypothetical protein HYV77_03550 [Candidatus Wildermuthbacteria bacterium]|nr:hypothetical protein [Candidatus Wildermuthbacteria bacterium]
MTSKHFAPKIAKSARIEKGAVIKGEVFIGENTVIKENTIVEGPCFIGDNCEIGYSNVLRGPISLESGVKTGAFCEIKHSIVQKNSHFHSGYIGDSVVGENCRFGAGFITANRRIDRGSIKVTVKGEKVDTQITFLGAVVGANTRFGIHTGTMPGVVVGSDCLVGPGVYVFENIPSATNVMSRFSYEKKDNKAD